MTTRSEYGYDPAAGIVQKYGHRCHTIEPLLEDETFVFNEFEDADLPENLANGFLPQLIDLGALTVDKRTRTNGSRYCRYRWAEGVREGIRQYLDELESLPCGHRWHIHNPPDVPPGELGCKFCDETHSKAAVRAAKEGGGSA